MLIRFEIINVFIFLKLFYKIDLFIDLSYKNKKALLNK
ncbi:hypothetical protein SAMN06265349_102324 [Flavobacterium resistens]|uniref:Uncharacterized protein n=1 Tax=Flavobacterium resistens TaxID=443612 RepID=A0A521C940_9FLAO|nr:hypothetical protein SAMN06265349_102324 [Flavobacterium resistens]